MTVLYMAEPVNGVPTLCYRAGWMMAPRPGSVMAIADVRKVPHFGDAHHTARLKLVLTSIDGCYKE